MAITKITADVIDTGTITADNLHATLDLSSKTLTLPTAQTATTQSAGDNSTKVATTAYVETATAALVDSAPGTLNTLNELAAALGDDANFSTTVTNSIATKLPLAGGTMTGALAMNANAITSTGDLTLDVATNIVLDADGGGIYFKDGGTTVGFLQNDGGDFRLVTSASDKDFKILGNDGGSTITALSFDMSAEGAATFNNLVDATNYKINGGQGSDGQVLTSTGSGVAWEDAAGGVDGIVSSANATAITIDSSENVGIGTASPTAPLDVVSNSSAIGIDLRGRSSDNIGQLSFESNDSATTYSQIQSRSTELLVKTVANIPMTFHTNNTERMTIASDGIVYFGPNGSTADPRINRHSNGYDYINSGDSRWLKIGGSSGHTNVAFQDGSSGVTVFETAGSERMRITNTGNVGIGINSPSTELHVYSADQNALTVETNTGINQIHLSNSTNSPTYITQDSYALVLKADDNAWGGTASSMQFRVKNSESMRIDSNGRLNLGAVAHSANINQAILNCFINSSAIPVCRFAQGNTSSSVPVVRCRHENSSSGFYIDFRTDENVQTGSIKDVSGTMQYQSASDSRLKENVEPMAEGLTEVLAMNPVKFTWKDIVTENKTVDMESAESRGFLAQELNEEYPWAVSEGGEDEKDDPWSVDYGKLTPVLVKAIQELKEELDAAKARIETLENP